MGKSFRENSEIFLNTKSESFGKYLFFGKFPFLFRYDFAIFREIDQCKFCKNFCNFSRNYRIFCFHENLASFFLPFSKFLFAKQFANTTETSVKFRIFSRKISIARNPSNVYSFHLLDIL